MLFRATRRQFTLALATGLAACATPKATSSPGPAAAAPPPATPAPAAAAPGSPPATPLGDALFAVLVALHGERLSKDELAKLRKPIADLADASAKLRALPLPNAAEPSGGAIGNPGDAS